MNYTRELQSALARIDDLDQRLDEATAGLQAAGAAALSLLHALVARAALTSDDWRAALADISQSAELELGSMPIAGPHAARVRAFAMGVLNGSVRAVGDAAERWDALGRPDVAAMLDRPN